jgi:HPt (histidine-containing phosphotransfer) domain-containing protein
MTKISILSALIACAIAVFTIISRMELRHENERLADNQRALLSDVEHYKTKDSLNVASVERLTLTKSELENHCSELTQTVEDLNIKLKRLQSVSRTATQVEYKIETVFKDSVIVSYKDSTKFDTVRCVNYSDKWLTFSACERNDTLVPHIKSRDELTTVAYRVPKKFWFIRYGTKAIRLTVTSNNPYSDITYLQYIELKK